MNDIRPLRYVDFSDLEPNFRKLIEDWYGFIRERIPTDATEDFHIGAQHAYSILYDMIAEGKIKGELTPNTLSSLGLAMFFTKQMDENVFEGDEEYDNLGYDPLRRAMERRLQGNADESEEI